MNELTQKKPLIKESAAFYRTKEGREQMAEALNKVSGKVEIKPPLTLEKLMSVFGTTVLLFPPDISEEKPLKVGRISTEQERNQWLNSLSNLDLLLNNQNLEEEILKISEEKENNQILSEINSLNSFAEEVAIRARVLMMEINSGVIVSNPGYPLPNQLKIGEMLANQLDSLNFILEIEKTISRKNKKPIRNPNEEKKRKSEIATESLLKKDFLSVSSSASYQAMREVVALKRFKEDTASPYPTAFVEKASIRGKIQLTPLETKAVYGDKLKELEASMWKKREQLSDLHVDVIDAMCATWIVQAGSDESRAVITADDILKLRGLKPHKSGTGRRGGYTMKQREEVIEAIQDLENIWFEITEQIKRGKRSKSDFIQSRAIAVLDRGGQMRIDGSLDVMWFVFRPGSIFARYLLNEGRQSALLAAQALRYNVRTQAVEKRLVRYLSWQWRIRSKSAGYMQPYEAQTLIREAGIKIPKRNAARACERLEKALDRLQSDGLITGWQYNNWDWSKANKHGWIKKWLTEKIVVEPPDFIRDNYETIGKVVEERVLSAKPGKTKRSIRNDADVAISVKQKRKAFKFSQMQLAEMLDLSQPTLSRIETGRKVSLEEKQKVLKWLAEESQ
jgi:DNA-binding XRE family transcriptional regulator